MITKMHHYFVLPPNSWPLSSSICSFNLMFSLLIFFKYSFSISFYIGLSILGTCMFYWWMNYKKEYSMAGMNSMDLESGLKTGMILFISSEVFFFFSFFWAYFHFFLSPGMENGFFWPPFGVIPFEAELVPFLNTMILLSSGVTATMAHFFLNSGDNKLFNMFLSLTVVLGLVFSYFQALEYSSSFFSLSDGNYGSSFFLLTGFHGIHVMIGSLFLFCSLIMSLSVSSSSYNFVSFEMSCWYWHFVDVVWIFLFFFLYYLNN